ncbi:DMT family transporter [Pedobacter antarcticus]|uniref:DMT family transporter n=1 Tax=Pedobacter antarcticus TaxID=34086 RepID=UPI00292D103A|nr:DMT family transporter [Pedobacter antarcticus]
MKNESIKGYLLAFTAATLWGVSGTFGQFLFEFRDINPGWLVTLRLLFSGIILLSVSISKADNQLFKIWKNRNDAIQLVLFSILGMLAVQYTYFEAINQSNAATATVLQYLGPVMIACFYALKERRVPSGLELAAIALALCGTFLLVTHGSIHTLTITRPALFWGLLSAVALAYYSIQPVQLLKKYSSLNIIGWAMFIGGLAFTFVYPVWEVKGTWDTQTYAYTAFVLVLGSLVPFYMYLSSIQLIGAKKSSLLACAEPLSATFMAVIWLDVPFGQMEIWGTICIITTIMILTQIKKPLIH